jgi:drug/metabolite transporter (DMT)-like permease
VNLLLRRPAASAWLLFAAVGLLWGIPYLFIKIAIVDLSPGFVVFARNAIAAMVLIPVVAARGLLPSLRGHLGLVLTLAVVHIVAPFLLIAYGELYITSSLTALIIAVDPIVIALMLMRSEPFTPLRVVGLLLGFGGVATLTGIELRSGGRALLGVAMVLLATVCYAFATILVKRKGSGIPPTALVTGTVVVSAVLLAPFAALQPPTGPVRVSSWASLVVLGLFCSALAGLAFYALIAAVGPNTAGLVTYVNPVVAVALGVAVLHEPLRPSLIAGSALILAGCWLATRPRRQATDTGQAGPAPRPSGLPVSPV